MAARKKNSLVANINRRRRAGKSRSKQRSTVSRGSYKEMQAGWPHSAKAKRTKSARQKLKKESKKKSAKKKSTRKTAHKTRARKKS